MLFYAVGHFSQNARDTPAFIRGEPGGTAIQRYLT